LTSPSCKSTLCEIVDMPDALYDIKFTPQEEGIHIVSLKNKGLHISGRLSASYHHFHFHFDDIILREPLPFRNMKTH